MRTLLVVAFATLAAGFSSASAGVVTETYSFSLGGFQDAQAGPPVPSPVSTISGSFTVTFDPALDFSDDTADLVVHSFSGVGVPLDSPLGFSYSAANQEFALGGLEGNTDDITPGTNDFTILLDLTNLSKPQFFPCSTPGLACGAFNGNPAFISAAFTRSGADFDKSLWIAATAESVVAVPEPPTWAMMFGGLALVALAGARRRTKVTRSFGSAPLLPAR
jgi:hypothetical protein